VAVSQIWAPVPQKEMFHAAETHSRVDLTKAIYKINKRSIVEKETAILPYKPMKLMVCFVR
jgi:hypothetical protein